MSQTVRHRFYLSHVGIPLLCAAAVFVLFDLSNLDVILSNLLYNPDSHTFVLQHSYLFEKITHKWARIIPNWTGEIAIMGCLLSFIWPRLDPCRHPRLLSVLERSNISLVLALAARYRKDLLFVVIAFAVSTGCIHFFKSHTSVYCPVETTLFGGAMPKIEWFRNFILWHDAGEGRCWPGGHASGGFSMLALYFIARRYRWRYAKTLLCAALALGLVYGTTRVFQGWHYMSHTFWSGIVVWLSMLLTALAFYGRQALEQPFAVGIHHPRVRAST